MIFDRADANKPFMGLTTFTGEHPTRNDIMVAKNYLNEDELKILNNLVSGYFDFAEIQAMRRKPMYMADYIAQLDNILASTSESLLVGAGRVSHKQAQEKATAEYLKYQERTLSPVEQAYFESIKVLAEKISKKKK